MDPNDQSISELIKLIRRQLALSQEALARELGVSFATVNRWENGHCMPSKLAQARLHAFCEKAIGQGNLIGFETLRR